MGLPRTQARLVLLVVLLFLLLLFLLLVTHLSSFFFLFFSIKAVWLLNSCTVKNPSESHFVSTITKGEGLFIYLFLCHLFFRILGRERAFSFLPLVNVRGIKTIFFPKIGKEKLERRKLSWFF